MIIAVGVVVLLAVLVGGFIRQNTTYVRRDRKAVAAAGFVEKTVDIAGLRTTYAEGPAGGTPLVLIHGQGSAWRDYSKVLPTLSRQYHVFAVDVYGHGGSARLRADDYTNAKIGDLLAEFMATVVGGPAIVSGHSSGGLLATWIAANRPELVAGLVLEDPPFFSSIPPRLATTTGGALPRLADAFLNQTDESDFQRYFVANSTFFEFFGPLQRGIVSYALKWIDRHPTGQPLEVFFLPPVATVFFQGLVHYDPEFGAAFHDGSWYEGFDTESALQAVRAPTVLVHTNYWFQAKGSYENNGILMAAMDGDDADRVVALLDDVTLQQVKSGHLVHFEKPQAYLDAVAVVDAAASR